VAAYLDTYCSRDKGAVFGSATTLIWREAYEPLLMVLLRAGCGTEVLEPIVRRAANSAAAGAGPLTHQVPQRNALWVALAAKLDVFQLVSV
jgi:hypothetical protein